MSSVYRKPLCLHGLGWVGLGWVGATKNRGTVALWGGSTPSVLMQTPVDHGLVVTV